MLSEKVSGFIEKNNLLNKRGKYLVALSGGADSVALLLVMKQLGYKIEAVHCNFHLRGEESDRDEIFCKRLCEELDVDFHITHFDTYAYAGLHKVSMEMAARELRYDYFGKLRRDVGADGICVAHHRDDSVETVIINLIRGTGVHGLTGISPRNGYVIRPLLCVSHDEIVGFLAAVGQGYVVDSTNLVDDVVRNKVRLNIIPLMKGINPAVCENIYKTSLRLREAEKVMENVLGAENVVTDNTHFVDIKKLKATPSPEYVLYYTLSNYGFSSAQVEQIAYNLEAQTGKVWYSPTHQLLFDRGKIIIEKKDGNARKSICIPECGTYIYRSDKKLHVDIKSVDIHFKIIKDKRCAFMDAAKITFPLVLRVADRGDRFVPFGMNGSKLVSDFLTDSKKTLFEKRRQYVVTSAAGDIVWVVDERPDNRFRVTDKTVKVLVLSTEDILPHV